MARLIDANKSMRETYLQEGIYPHSMIKKEIEAQPTVDAVEVVRGRWDEWCPSDYALIMTGEEMLYQCSACTASIPILRASAIVRTAALLWTNEENRDRLSQNKT